MINKMIKLIKTILPLIVAAVVTASCSGDDDKYRDGTIDGVNAARTVVCYMSAQNSLYNYQTADLSEMIEGAQSMPAGNKLVVYVDKADSTFIYVLTRYSGSNPKPVYYYATNQNSADPATLTALLEWTKTNHPGKEYGIVFWSHSDGWLPAVDGTITGSNENELSVNHGGLISSKSFGIDVGQGGNIRTDRKADGKIGDAMNIPDLASAIAASGIRFKYIFFDACLMQGLEVVYDLRNAADYIVASPMFIPGVGAYYTHMVPRALFADDPVKIASTYYSDATDSSLPASMVSNYSVVGLVISVVKTDMLEVLAAATKTALATTSINGAQPDMSGVQVYMAYNSNNFYRPEYFDAGMAMSSILSADAYSAWRAVYDQCVVYKAGTPRFYIYDNSGDGSIALDTANYTGVSMFVPQTKYTTNAPRCIYGDLNLRFQETSWYTATDWSVTGW